MESGQIYRDKDVKHIFMNILDVRGENVTVSFNFKRMHGNVFNYKKSYIENFYLPLEESHGEGASA